MSYELTATLIILIIMMVMFISNRFSFGGIAIMVICMLELSGVLTPKEAWNGLLNSSIPLVVSMFMLSAGLAKTSLLHKITKIMVRPDANDRQLMTGIAIMCAFFSVFVNATASVTLVTPLVYQVCRDTGRKPWQVFPAVGAICMITNGIIPLGGNAGDFNLNNQMIENMGGTGVQTYFSNMIVLLPAAAIVTVFIIFTWQYFAPKSGIDPEIDDLFDKKKLDAKISPGKERLMYAIFVLSIVFMVYGTLSGRYSMYIPTCIGAFIMVSAGICTVKEAHASSQMSVIYLQIGSLAIGMALGKTGGTELIGEHVQRLLQGTQNPRIVLAAFLIVPGLITQFMNNQAVNNVFKPIAISTALSMNLNATAYLLATHAAARAAMLTPMSAPSQAIAMGAGGVTMKDYMKANIIPLLVWVTAYYITAPFMMSLTMPG
ncbi:MAG: anion permease [Clostridium sp.]|nr:anion permease [Clostridium sp.]